MVQPSASLGQHLLSHGAGLHPGHLYEVHASGLVLPQPSHRGGGDRAHSGVWEAPESATGAIDAWRDRCESRSSSTYHIIYRTNQIRIYYIMYSTYIILCHTILGLESVCEASGGSNDHDLLHPIGRLVGRCELHDLFATRQSGSGRWWCLRGPRSPCKASIPHQSCLYLGHFKVHRALRKRESKGRKMRCVS